MIPKSLLADMNEALDQSDAAARAALAARLTDQPEAQAFWDAMQSTEQKLRAAPLLAPGMGFVQRFEARRNAQRGSSSKAWFSFFGGVVATGGLAVCAPLIVSLGLYAREMWMNGHVFEIIVRNIAGSGAAVAGALFTSAVALLEIAIPNPLTWLAVTGAVGIVVVWMYLIGKLTLEVSLT